jgi:DNA-binding NtrC family response regulator
VDLLPHKDLLFNRLTRNSYDLIFLEDEKEKLGSIKAMDPRVEVFLFGNSDLDVIEALQAGASACFSKPIEPEKFIEAVNRISELIGIRKETADLERSLKTKYTFSGVVGKNPQMLELFHYIRNIAPYYRTVLISGETGTGKEAVAKALHTTSPGAKLPFLVCNCGALVENLLESELFGHLKGSYTGAVADKTGLFEAAGEGTLLLDEIGELPLSFQPHLLRVLENGEFRRLGSTQTLRAKCRVIALTNRNLETEVKKGNFREDLFFRLTRLTIQVPPLQERMDEIPLLCQHLLARFNQRTGKIIYGISRPAMALLLRYNWPGNVRELENVLEQSAILTRDPFIHPQDIPGYLKKSREQEHPPLMSLDHMEKSYIEKTLQYCQGNQTKAAGILKISRRALSRKIQKFHLH